MPSPEVDPTQSPIRRISGTITWANRWDHLLARWGARRMRHRVEPALYALGRPTTDSPVFVTANYTLSFDTLRSALDGADGYILVLDTKGINVWCAAGKGTFGTEEVVRSIESTGLREVVQHRTLILPQLGAAGVAAHEVKKRSGFKVEYGPVRAADLKEYMETRKATPEMRQVTFGLRDRCTLIPVEIVSVILLLVAAALARIIFGGSWPLEAIAAILAGVVLVPILLPWIPTYDFSTKGLIMGCLVALPFALAELTTQQPGGAVWRRALGASTNLLIWAPVTAFLALNFTGATTFTSRSGVRREIYKYIPVMAWVFGAGLVLAVLHEVV